MGAAVQLYNRQEKVVDRVLTDGEGFFSFAGLVPDVYSVRITLGTFLPAIRNQIQVQAGRSSLLDVSLSGLFSAIRLLPSSAQNIGSSNDDWKWVLRSSSSTRPVFRYLPIPPPALSSSRHSAPVFSGTRGLVSFSAGDASTGGLGGEMGTAFAVATNVFGANQVNFAGTMSYDASNAVPSAAISSSYSRQVGSATPTVSVTMRQIYMPRWAGSEAGSGGAPLAGVPPIRTVGITLADKTQISENLQLTYGFEVDTIAFVDHVHYFSPYARLTYALAPGSNVHFSYTGGNARPGLDSEASLDPALELQRDVAALAAVPHVTLRSHRAQVQRGDNFELGYSRKLGSREVRVSGYRQSIQNAAVLISGADSSSFLGDVLPDLYTNGVVFDAGNYQTMGYTASLTQHLGDNDQVSVLYGTVGTLAPTANKLSSDSPEELRSILRPSNRQAIAILASAAVPRTGTHLAASYQWMDSRTVSVGNLSSADSRQPNPGLNIVVRQPIPPMFGMPFHMEATADMTNILAEGYLPVTLSDGRRVLLVHTPRSLRGGLNFRF